MIKSVKGSATRRFIEGGRSSFSGMNEALAYQCLAERDAAVSLADFKRLKSLGLHKLKGNIGSFVSAQVPASG